MFATPWEESVLRQTFNCPLPKHEDFQVAAKLDDVPEFEETDVETSESSDGSFLQATDSEQELLVATDEEAPAASSCRPYTRRRQEDFQSLGKTVCGRACARLLGVGQNTLQRLRRGEAIFTMKSKPALPKHPSFGFTMRGETSQKWTTVVIFLWMIYHSSAECLPTDFVSDFKKGKAEAEDTEFPEDSAQHDDVLRSVNGFMRSLHQYNSDLDAHMIGPGFFSRGEEKPSPWFPDRDVF